MSAQVILFENGAPKPSASKTVPLPGESESNTFDVTKFAENFDVLAEAEGAFKRLRELLLDLAVRGKLTNPGFVAPPGGDAVQFGLPREWEWRAGREVFTFVTSGSRGWAQFYADDGSIFLRIGNLDYQSIQLDLRAIQRVRPPPNAEGTRTKVQAGDVLISITGDTGMVGLVPDGLGDAYINQHIALARPGPAVLPAYVARALTAPALLGRIQGAQRGIKNSLGLDDIRDLFLPIPPLAEQKRVVAKVDELMRLLDDLEAKQAKKRETQARLRTAALDALTSAEGPNEVEAAWKRVAENFYVLIDRAETMPEVRAALLELALHGKLTARGRHDVGADSLLRTIDAHWTESGRSKRGASGASGPASDDSTPPRGWAKCNVGRVVQISSGVALPSHAMTKGGTVPVYGGNGVTGHHDQANVSRSSIVMGRVGFYCGSVHLTPDCAWVTDNAFVVSYPEECFDRRFLYWLLLRTGRVVRRDGGATAQPVISGKKLYPLPIWLPPLEEQRRIAARMDQLMKLCDDLEAKLQRSAKMAAKLVEAVATEMVSSGAGG